MKSFLLNRRLFIAVFVAFVAAAVMQAGRADAAMKLVRSAPAFEAKTLDGKVFRLKSMIGSPVVINFWASWCPACREEAGGLQRAYVKYKKSGVKFIAMAVDDDVKNVKEFMKRFGWTMPVAVLDTEDITAAYNIYGLPKTVVVDKAGIIAFEHLGAISEEELTAQLKDVLSK